MHLLLKEYVQEKIDFQAFIFLFKEQVLLVKCAGNEFFISLTLIGFFFYLENDWFRNQFTPIFKA